MDLAALQGALRERGRGRAPLAPRARAVRHAHHAASRARAPPRAASRRGPIAGATPEEAYRVRVGLGVTMTETDIDLGLLIIEVAAAPVKPAEFVVFRISHKRLTE